MIGFLLGAGFSKALHSDMPVMTELLNTLETADKIPSCVPDSIRTDLERTLSYLWTNYPWLSETNTLRNRADYIALVQDLHRILSESEYSAWRDLFSPKGYIERDVWQAQLAWILSMHDRSVVLTMNYDTLLERLMIAMNQDNWLVYPAPIQRLYGAWNQQEEITVTSRGPLGYGNFTPSLYKLHGCLSWYSLNALDENSIVYGLDMNQYYLRPFDPVPGNFADSLFPVIVPPVADKASMYSNKVLRSQWMGALDGLRRCDELYCVGYSFPKSDLPMQLFLAEACKKIRTVHLVNISQNIETEDRVNSLMNPSTIIDGIYGPNCVQDMTQRLVDSGLYRSDNWFTSST